MTDPCKHPKIDLFWWFNEHEMTLSGLLVKCMECGAEARPLRDEIILGPWKQKSSYSFFRPLTSEESAMKDQEFELTEQHIKLARQMYVGWQDVEYGAPEIDPKRPYGDSDVAGNIHEILTGEQAGELSAKQEGEYRALHEEMKTALQVILAAGTFEPGRFRAPAYSSRWERVE